MPASGSWRSSAPNTAFRPDGEAEAGGDADGERQRPIASASSSTEPSTCRRAAPTIRSSANSRVRWATVIESVLKIVNAPTKIATPPKTSSTILDDVDELLQAVEREAVLRRGGLDLRGRADRGGDGTRARRRRAAGRPATRTES